MWMERILLQFGLLTAVVLLIGPILGFIAADWLCAYVTCGVWRENGTLVIVYILACYATYRLTYKRQQPSKPD